MKKSLTIGFCAGEVSGDLHGGYLFKRIKKEFPNIDIKGFGIGGPIMESSGIEILHDLTHRSSVGIIESLPYVFDRYKLGKKLLKEIEIRKPDIFIFIDNQGFNIPLSFEIKKANVKTIYYFPPPIAIWGKWNGKKLQKSIDYFFIPFKEDYIEYKKINSINSFFFGHPFFDLEYLKEQFETPLIDNDIKTIINILEKREIEFQRYKSFNNFEYSEYIKSVFVKNTKKLKYIYLMPGSRKQEIKTLLPLFVRVARTLFKEYNIITILPISNKNFENDILNIINRENGNEIKEKFIFTISKNYYWIYKNALFSLMASGTATLEGLILNVPMLICYKISGLTFFLGKLFVNTKWVGMANIIGKTEVAKEFLQKKMNYKELIEESKKLIEDTSYYNNKKLKMKEILNILEKDYSKDAISKYAKKIIELV